MGTEAVNIDRAEMQTHPKFEGAKMRMNGATCMLSKVADALGWQIEGQSVEASYASVKIGPDVPKDTIDPTRDVLNVSIDYKHPEATYVVVFREKTLAGHTVWRDIIQDGQNLQERLPIVDGKIVMRKGRRLFGYDVEKENDKKIRVGILTGLGKILNLKANTDLENNLKEILELQNSR